MELKLLSAFVGGLLIAGPGQNQQPEARALIEKAIAAHNETYQGKRLAYYSKMKGKFTEYSMVGTSYKQADDRHKTVTTADVGGAKFELTEVYDGKKGWTKMTTGGQDLGVKEFDQADYDRQRTLEFHGRIGFLVELLTDPSIGLKLLGDERFHDQDLTGLAITSKNQEEVRLYFDKVTHLVTGWRYKKKDMNAKEVTHDVVLSDYRDLGLFDEDKASLKSAGIAEDGTAAVAYLAKLIPTEDEMKALKELIVKLGDKSFTTRETATNRLKKAGPKAIPFLRKASRSPDSEVAERASDCLKSMQGAGTDRVPTAVVRLIGCTWPAKAVESLFEYLPHAQDDSVALEAKAVLALLAKEDGKPHPVMAKALKSEDQWERDMASALLGRDGGEYLNQPGRPIYLPHSKYPARQTYYEDGKLLGEVEYLEICRVNRFDDAMFAEPN